jgi:hypothetical protein
MGQSSSVMLDQKTQIMMTESKVKRVEKKPPLMAPFEPLQMCTLITYWKIWEIAKRRAAAPRYTERSLANIQRKECESLRLTHWANFAEHAEDQNSLQNEEDHDENERHKLVKGVQSICPVVRVRDGILPVVGESETSVERDVASADEESSCGAEDETNGCDRSVVKYLVSDHGVHEQNPESGHDRGDVDGCESYPYPATKWEPANGEDLAYRDDDVAEKEQLHLSVRMY